MDSMPIEIFCLPDHATYRDHWPLLQLADDGWAKLAAGDSCFVSEQLSRRMKLAVGDHIDLPTPTGDWRVSIVGIYAYYGNPKNQVAINVAALARHFPGAAQTRLNLLANRKDVPVLIAALSDRFGLDGRNLIDQATLKEESLRIFDRPFAVPAARNAFRLGVDGVGLLTGRRSLPNSRRPQLAP